MKRVKKALLNLLNIVISMLSLSSCLENVDNNNSVNYGTEFEFALNRDEESYFLTKYTGKNRVVSIPNKFSGLPISGIGLKAFKENEYIEKVFLPNTIKEIEYEAFYNAINLKEIEFQEGIALAKIGRYAFYNTNLSSFAIPNSVTTIDEGSFGNIGSLESLALPFIGKSRSTSGLEANFGHIFGTSSFEQGYNANGYYLPIKLKEIMINEAPIISEYAFKGAWSLTNVVLSNGVTSIGREAFYGASGLSTFFIPNTVTSIGQSAFFYASSLTTIVIPSSVLSMGGHVFSNIQNLTIFAEAESKPLNWDQYWNNYYDGWTATYYPHPTYWAGQWHYLGGKPTPNY